jgi:methanogenic corrinoid protein MtbC1
MTHGICQSCQSNASVRDPQSAERAKPLVAAYRQMRLALSERRMEDCLALVQRAQAELQIRPFDLFMGVVQPLLQEIGVLWSQGKLSVAHEHQFTAFAEVLLANLLNANPSQSYMGSVDAIDVVLACADGNYHSIGPRALDLALRNAGFSTKLFVPGLPAVDIVELVRMSTLSGDFCLYE